MNKTGCITRKVLICEDQQQNYEKIKTYFEKEGFVCSDRVGTFEECHSVLTDANNKREYFELIMIDLCLKHSGEKRSGIQLYESLLLDYPNENYAVYTTTDMQEFREEIGRLRYRDVQLIVLDQVLSKQNIGLYLAKLVQDSNPRSVFLVCGRNKDKNEAITKFLQKGLGLEVIDWEMARARVKGRDFIFEIVLQGIMMSQATVVLFTDDEEIKLRGNFCKSGDPDHAIKGKMSKRRQARPNVFIEAGYACGVRPKQTIFVDWPDRISSYTGASDFEGLHTVRFNGDPTARDALRRRLEDCRCLVNPCKTWKTIGL